MKLYILKISHMRSIIIYQKMERLIIDKRLKSLDYRKLAVG